jgi:hypothetical protein
MEINGKVIAKPASKTGVSARGPWKRALLVVRYEDGQYPKDLLLSNMNKAEDFERIPIGMTGTFKFDGSVRENNGNYYLDLNCWSWRIDEQTITQPSSSAPF